jgi:hypothetical protein
MAVGAVFYQAALVLISYTFKTKATRSLRRYTYVGEEGYLRAWAYIYSLAKADSAFFPTDYRKAKHFMGSLFRRQ